jgi:hypothetical protein
MRRITGKAVLPENQQNMYHKSYYLIAGNRCSKAEASLTRLQLAVDKSLDDNLQG